MALEAAYTNEAGRLAALRQLARTGLEAERDRWLLWLPVCLGAGIGIYFWSRSEPALWVSLLPIPLALAAAVASFRRPILFAIALALTAGTLGFGAAKLSTELAAAPVLDRRVGPIRVEARVLEVESLPEGARVIAAPRDLGPARIRMRLRGDDVPAPGEWIAVRAILMPPPPPTMPGAYDFQRQAWFDRLGAVGFAVGKVERLDPPAGAESGIWLGALARLRHAMTDRILAALPPGVAGVAAALITGDRGSIPAGLNSAYRDSGLAHLLSISGIHMSLVGGLAFVAIRALLALVPPLALRWNIKKGAAALALVFVIAYTLLSGASVPAQRSCFMTALALLAVMIDRLHISMRVVAWTAVAVMLITPSGVLGPSFQMSFAAVIGLIAFYETYGQRLSSWRAERGAVARFGFYFIGLACTTIIATAATTPFSIYHFNRFALHGLAANAIAVPLTGFWIMPWAMVASLLMPFGIESWGLVPMGWGIAFVNWVAVEVSSWPGATVGIPALPAEGLMLISLGGLWLSIWRARWRLLGFVPILVGAGTVWLDRPPDIVVSGDAGVIAVRARDGSYMFSTARPPDLLKETWTRRAGAEPGPSWPAGGQSDDGRLACDAIGCIYQARGRTVALVRDGQALTEDCGVDLIVSVVPARKACRGHDAVVDRFDLWRQGAHAIWLDPDGIGIHSVNEWRGERPWVPRRGRLRDQ